MTSKKHSKKRNSALIFEQLARVVSRALVDGDKQRSAVALRVVKQHFKPGTELFREFRLLNSLVKTTVSSEAVAASILQEAKRAARSLDGKLLDEEKTQLVHAVNRELGRDVYDQHVSDYRTYATVATLVSDWRARDPDLERIAEYEDKVVSHLTSAKAKPVDSTITESSPGQARLLVKVMMQKLNDKYSGSLTREQKDIVRAYAWSTAKEEQDTVRQKLEEVKSGLLGAISTAKEGDFVEKKLTEVKGQLEAEDLSVVDDSTVTRFMLYAKLREELASTDRQ